jgi:DnaJ like chaperone protein
MLKLMNNYTVDIKGFFLGALLGGICADIWGAVVGAVIGALFIRMSKNEKLKLPEDFPLTDESVLKLFQCFGKFAKDDGRVSENEAITIKEQMLEWQFSDETRKFLKLEFNAGRDSQMSFDELFKDFISTLNPAQKKFHCDIVHVFTALAYADGKISLEKRRKLIYIAEMLDRRDFLENLMQMFDIAYEDSQPNSQDNERTYQKKDHPQDDKRTASPVNEDSMEKYYKILEIPVTATNTEVKKAWRKKAQEFHPDKVQGAGLSNAFIEYATKQLQQINEAYDKICKTRGM